MNSANKALCFRILVIVLTAIIWIIGGVVLGFSIWLRLDFWINQYVGASDELQKYTVAVYIFIATGALIILFGIVGVYGAARPDKWGLVAYLIFLPLILILMVGAGVYGYIYREEIETTIKNSQFLREMVQKKYSIDPKVTNAFDYMQWELKCCGGTSYTDYMESVWRQNDLHFENRRNKAPLTCCNDYWKYKDAPGSEFGYCSIYLIDPDTSGNQLPTELNYKLFRKGCGEAIVEFFEENIGIIAAIGFSIVGLLVLDIIFVSLLLYFLRKAPAPREDDVVYEMARTQEKSPYPARGGPYANLYQS